MSKSMSMSVRQVQQFAAGREYRRERGYLAAHEARQEAQQDMRAAIRQSMADGIANAVMAARLNGKSGVR